jgi:hypothetical protein
MELEIQRARQTETAEQARQHLYTVKTLCEIMLDNAGLEESQSAKSITVAPAVLSAQRSILSSASQPLHREERMQTEDGANGNSIFDF